MNWLRCFTKFYEGLREEAHQQRKQQSNALPEDTKDLSWLGENAGIRRGMHENRNHPLISSQRNAACIMGGGNSVRALKVVVGPLTLWKEPNDRGKKNRASTLTSKNSAMDLSVLT